MKVTLEISEEDLAAIFQDTWEDKDKRTMEERLVDTLGARALQFRRAFPKFTVEAQIERYRASPHRVIPAPDALAEKKLRDWVSEVRERNPESQT